MRPAATARAGFLAALLTALAGAAAGDVLRYDSAADWSAWQLPTGSLTVGPGGRLEPQSIRKRINAAADARVYGGGVSSASSNGALAGRVLDGDATTGWAPTGVEPDGEAFLEIDLGRAVSARSVTLRFAQAAAPFELFDLQLSTGEPKVDIVGNPIPGDVIYRWSERVRGNTRHELTFDLDPAAAPVRFLRLEPLLYAAGARLTEVEVWSIGDNAALGLLERGGNVDVVVGLGRSEFNVPLGNARSLVDGDLVTVMRFGATPGRGVEDIDAHFVLDLGAAYWVDQVRVIGEVLRQRHFRFKDYSFMTADGTRAPDGTLIWERHFSGRASPEDNDRGFVDFHFDIRPVRLVRVLWKFWDGSCASALAGGGQGATTRGCMARGDTEEVQVFGEGFPRELTLLSPILDLEDRRNFGELEWDGSTPAGTRIEVRTRTGNSVDERFVYRDRNGQAVTEKRWNRLIPSFRGPIDTLAVVGDGWSPWSSPYAGSGRAFASPSPRRFAQIELRLVTEDPDRAPVLDWLQLSHTPPLAQRTFGEVHPTRVPAGRRHDFSYFVRTDSASAGYDRIVLTSSAQPDFTGALVDGVALEVETEGTDDGFRATLSERVTGGQVLDLRFSSAVFLHGTRFEAFLEDSQLPGHRQRVDAGDAVAGVDSDTDVVGLPVDQNLLANVEFGTRVLTPNGDGHNDALEVRVDVTNLLQGRPLSLRVYDLAGRLVGRRAAVVQAGHTVLRWSGADAAGRPLAPGLYLIELRLEGDARSQSLQRVVSVVY